MNQRFFRVTIAIISILVAGILVSGAFLFAGSYLHQWLIGITSPGVAFTLVLVVALIAGAACLFGGQAIFRSTFQPANTTPRNVDELLVGELLKVVDGNSTKLVMAALGVGFAMGLSPRLRRSIYRMVVD